MQPLEAVQELQSNAVKNPNIPKIMVSAKAAIITITGMNITPTIITSRTK